MRTVGLLNAYWRLHDLDESFLESTNNSTWAKKGSKKVQIIYKTHLDRYSFPNTA